MQVWKRTKKRQTLLNQRLSLFWWNIVYAGFYTKDANR